MRHRIIPTMVASAGIMLLVTLVMMPMGREHVSALARQVERPQRHPRLDPRPATPAAVPPGSSANSLASASWAHPCGLVDHPRPARHVIWIWFENQNFLHALQGAATAHLAGACGVASNYLGITHPSLPNYMAAVSGSRHGVVKDCLCTFAAPSLMLQVKSWRLYAESMPSSCDETDALPYQAHHNVALHFSNIDCPADDVPLTRLLPDLAARRLPEFSFIVPNACHSMHWSRSGCHHTLTRELAIRSANQWLHGLLVPILRSRAYRSGHTVIFIAWDEGEPVTHTGERCLVTRSVDCQTAAIVVAPSVVPRTVATTLYDPYSLLRTTEGVLGLPLLGGARHARSMRAAFNL